MQRKTEAYLLLTHFWKFIWFKKVTLRLNSESKTVKAWEKKKNQENKFLALK